MGNLNKKIAAFKTQPFPANIKNRLERLQNTLATDCNSYSHLELFAEIYGAADEFMETLVYPFSPCAKGCDYCCHVPVEVTAIEAIIMTEMIDRNLQVGSVPPVNLRDPCPFLKNNECSIYANRPLVCRMFATLDTVEACIEDREHAMHSIKSNDFFLKIVMMWLVYNSSNLTISATLLPTVRDIREWFHSTPHERP